MNFEALFGIRGVPLGLWCGVHFMLFNMPAWQRVRDYGFSFSHFDRGERWRLLTHTFIHFDETHLASNSAVYAVAALNFTPMTCDGFGTHVVRSMKPLEVAVGVTVLASGAIGGVLGMSALHRWNAERVAQEWDYGVDAIKSLARTVHRTQTDYTLMCGASASVAALMTFNIVNNHASGLAARALPLLLLYGPELLQLIDQQRQVPSLLSGFNSGAPFGVEQKPVRIGYAAHLGGMMAGMLVALAWAPLRRKLVYLSSSRRSGGGPSLRRAGGTTDGLDSSAMSTP